MLIIWHGFGFMVPVVAVAIWFIGRHYNGAAPHQS